MGDGSHPMPGHFICQSQKKGKSIDSLSVERAVTCLIQYVDDYLSIVSPKATK